MSLDEISNLIVSTTPDVDWEYYSYFDRSGLRKEWES